MAKRVDTLESRKAAESNWCNCDGWPRALCAFRTACGQHVKSGSIDGEPHADWLPDKPPWAAPAPGPKDPG
jgi:hypothetical protein